MVKGHVTRLKEEISTCFSRPEQSIWSDTEKVASQQEKSHDNQVSIAMIM